MTYFVVHYGIWILLAFVSGLLSALLSLRKDSSGGLLRRSDFLPTLCALLFIAFAQVTLGRIALYAESAMLILVAFVAGAGLIVAFVGRISRDHIGWRLGASSVVLTWLAANLAAARDLEGDLKHRLGSLVERAGGESLDFEVRGRDVLLPADMKDRTALAERIRHAAGVRIVWRVEALSPPAAELRNKTMAAAAAALAQRRAAEAAWALRQSTTGARSEPRGEMQKETRAAAKSRGARDAIAEGRSATPAAAIVWKTPIDPTLPRANGADAVTTPAAHSRAESETPSCRTELSGAVVSEKIHFAVASASFHSGSEPFLDRLAGLLKQCPEATLEIGGHTDSQGDREENRSLSLRRARVVVDYLVKAGVERGRLDGVGHGADRPLATGDSPTSRAENRRVEFTVK